MSARRYAVRAVFETVQGEGINAGRRAVFVRFAGCNAWTGEPHHRERDRARTGAACALWCDTEFRRDAVTPLYTAEELAERVLRTAGVAAPEVIVLSGGEPLLQVDAGLIAALRALYADAADARPQIAVETNGSVAPRDPLDLDLLTLSPKRGLPCAVLEPENRLRTITLPMCRVELKVVVPGVVPDDPHGGWDADALLGLVHRALAWCGPHHRWLQPQDPPLPHARGAVETTHLHHLPMWNTPAASEAMLRASALYRTHVLAAFELQRQLAARGSAWRLSAQAHKTLALP